MKLLYVTNIPTPYRNKRYNVMQEVFPDYGIDFEVLYMAWTEPTRFWTFTPEDFRYPYTVYKGVHPTVGGMYAHVNPGLIARLMHDDYDVGIVGGLGSPSHWLAGLAMRSDALRILSVESNPDSVRRTKGLAHRFKRHLIRRFDAYQVTGPRALDYLTLFDPSADQKPIITLPNLIDEEVFCTQVEKVRPQTPQIREAYGVPEAHQLWFCPARLEEMKGLHLFLPHLKGVEGITMLIAGDGSQRELLQAMIDDEDLPVRLLGHCTQDEIVKLYAASDVFVLPSLRDPSPLSPIEAAAAGLPLLVSQRIGNLCDVLDGSSNGWSFDPVTRGGDVRDLILNISSLEKKDIILYGSNSKKVYESRFTTVKRVKDFAESIKSTSLDIA